MFRSCFKRKEPVKVPEPVPPYEIGQIVNLVENEVDFQVKRVIHYNPYDHFYEWEVMGKAFMLLPVGSTNVDIQPNTNNSGEVRSFGIKYDRGHAKTSTILQHNWPINLPNNVSCVLEIVEVIAEAKV